jgi:hypothetical protein
MAGTNYLKKEEAVTLADGLLEFSHLRSPARPAGGDSKLTSI